MRLANTGGNAGVEILTASDKHSFLLGAQYNINNGFEITPSTATGGTTFSTPAVAVLSSGNVGINESAPDYRLDVNGSFGFTPGTSVTPVDNGDVVIEATNNTTLTFKLKGSDGTVRTGTITLA